MTAGVSDDANCAQLDTTLVDYLKSIPTDPGGADTAAGHTEYTISRTGATEAKSMFTISACSAEGTTVEVSR